MLNTNWRYVDATGSDVVGWSAPTSKQPLWPYERIAASTHEFMQAGFSAIVLPPATKGSAGTFSGGYDLFDNYDIGSKNQQGNIATAFGTSEMLRQCIAMIHSNGMQAYGDLVVHQYDGGPNNTYVYKGANDAAKMGRFPKTPGCFAGPPPGVPTDPVPDSSGNFGFGAMASYINSQPPNYMWDGTIAAATWLQATTDFDGYRIDDVKGTNGSFVYHLRNSTALRNLYCFGEYFTGFNPELWNWVHGYMQGTCPCMDFGFKFNVGNICNNNSSSWMGALSQIGYCAIDAKNAVTFCDSADTDTTPGEQMIWNKMLGYAIMLTFPGYPEVYYRDWSTDPGCYGLKERINNLIWIHEHLAQGDFVPRLNDHFQVFVHERMGYLDAPGCICGFNNDQYHEYTVTVPTRYPPNTRLHEYTGHYNTDVWTDWAGNVTFTLPKNNNGLSYLVFGQWMPPVSFNRPARHTSQTYFGASDLDIAPLTLATNLSLPRLYIKAATTITLTLALSESWQTGMVVMATVYDPTETVIGTLTWISDGIFSLASSTTGWYRIILQYVAPATGPPTQDFALTIDYQAPQVVT